MKKIILIAVTAFLGTFFAGCSFKAEVDSKLIRKNSGGSEPMIQINNCGPETRL